jgi:hypothetical protein
MPISRLLQRLPCYSSLTVMLQLRVPSTGHHALLLLLLLLLRLHHLLHALLQQLWVWLVGPEAPRAVLNLNLLM